jgi:hypothetical protein
MKYTTLIGFGFLRSNVSDGDDMPRGTVDGASERQFGALLVIGRGVLTALVPGLGEPLTRKMVPKNFENADALEAKPASRRRRRAVGIGTAAVA